MYCLLSEKSFNYLTASEVSQKSRYFSNTAEQLPGIYSVLRMAYRRVQALCNCYERSLCNLAVLILVCVGSISSISAGLAFKL